MSFSQKVYKVTSKIPKGQILTYKQIAQKIGCSKGARAVGNALNKSPGMKGGVPCHRVIRSNGEVGGFASGTATKIRMLSREGLEIKNGKIKL